MFCPGCAAENPAQAVYCFKCGARLPQEVPGQGYVLPGQPVAAGAAAPQPGYLWGYIQGWGMVVGGPLLFLVFLAVLLAPTSNQQARLGAVILMVALTLGTVTGLGLLRKAKFGLLLVYVWAGVHVLLMLVCLLALIGAPGDRNVHIGALVVLLGLVFWAICAIYYHRRRTLFR